MWAKLPVELIERGLKKGGERSQRNARIVSLGELETKRNKAQTPKELRA